LNAKLIFNIYQNPDVGDLSLKEHAREWFKQSLIMTDEEKKQNERAMKAFRESLSKSLTTLSDHYH